MYGMKKTEVLKIRITEEQNNFITKIATDLNINKSDVVRKLIEGMMATHENKKTDINH